jgi:hypothetical protein
MNPISNLQRRIGEKCSVYLWPEDDSTWATFPSCRGILMDVDETFLIIGKTRPKEVQIEEIHHIEGNGWSWIGREGATGLTGDEKNEDL